MEAEIQLTLKRFPDFSVSSLIQLVDARKGIRSPKTRSRIDNYLMVTGPLVVEIISCEVSPKVGCLPRGKCPTLALKHYLFLRAYPDSRSPDGFTPSERITLRHTTPATAIAPLENIMPSS